MKIRLFGIVLVGLTLVWTAWADDLPRMGYEPKVSVKELAAKGYRWVTANGPYGCANERALRQITRPIHDIYGIVETPDTAGLIDPSDAAEIGLVRAGPTPREPMSTTRQSIQQGIAVK